jgi:putative transposase
VLSRQHRGQPSAAPRYATLVETVHRHRCRRSADDHGSGAPEILGAREPQEDPSDSEAQRLASPATAARASSARPGWISRANRPNERWAIDTTHLFTNREGWCHLTAIIDCCDRTIVGLEAVPLGHCRCGSGRTRGRAPSPSDRRGIARTAAAVGHGLAFGAKAFVAVVRRYRLGQEYITPYTPEQNGMIERFFMTLKQECVWLHRFENGDDAFRVIADWLDRYDAERPHSALMSDGGKTRRPIGKLRQPAG